MKQGNGQHGQQTHPSLAKSELSEKVSELESELAAREQLEALRATLSDAPSEPSGEASHFLTELEITLTQSSV